MPPRACDFTFALSTSPSAGRAPLTARTAGWRVEVVIVLGPLFGGVQSVCGLCVRAMVCLRGASVVLTPVPHVRVVAHVLSSQAPLQDVAWRHFSAVMFESGLPNVSVEQHFARTQATEWDALLLVGGPP